MAQHRTTKGIPIIDRDPQRYVEELEHTSPSQRTDYSLRIGSLKGE
jgi:hypothetical protein